MTGAGFGRPPQRAMVLVDDAPAPLLARLAAYRPPAVTRWPTPAEG